MGNMSLTKVRAGQPLDIPAVAWNRLVDLDAANRVGNQAGIKMPTDSRNILYVKNTSGAAIEARRSIAFEGSIFTDIATRQYREDPTLIGKTPVLTTHGDRWGVTLEPIGEDLMGRVAIAGYVAVYCDIVATADRWLWANGTQPKSGSSGHAKILYAPPSTGNQIAIVQLGQAQRVWRYALTSDWSGTPPTASATLKTLAGTSTGIAITVRDPEVLMDDQVDGATGFCIDDGLLFYAIQAPCGA